jgi:hypothetical protein
MPISSLKWTICTCRNIWADIHYLNGCIPSPNEHRPLRQILHNNNNTHLYMSNVLPGHKHVEHFSISIIIEKMHIFGKYTIKTRQYCNFILTYSMCDLFILIDMIF